MAAIEGDAGYGPTIAAVDIGGTKLAVAVVSGRGEVLVEGRAPTHGAGPDGLFSALGDLLDDTIAASPEPPDAIGVGCGGPMTP